MIVVEYLHDYIFKIKFPRFSLRILISGFYVYLLMTGCGLYHPMLPDIPLINKKNELRIDVGISSFPAAHATVSYGVSEKIAIQGFSNFGVDNNNYFQLATGLYKNMNNRKIFELYAGGGYGNGKIYNNVNPGTLSSNYQLYFIQANLGKISGKSSNLEAGLGLKGGFMNTNVTNQNYYDFSTDGTAAPIEYQINSILLEPVAMLRIGGDRLKFSTRLGGAFIYNLNDNLRGFPYNKVSLTCGLNYNF